MKMLVDFVGQTDPLDKRMKSTDATATNRFDTRTHLVMNVTTRYHRCGLRTPMLPIKPAANSSFPVPEDLPIFLHLKCLSLLFVRWSDTQQ